MSWNGDNLRKTWIRSKRFGETKGKRETLRARGMSEIIETEMNVVFLCDLEENSPSRANTCHVARLRTLLTFFLLKCILFVPLQDHLLVFIKSLENKIVSPLNTFSHIITIVFQIALISCSILV